MDASLVGAQVNLYATDPETLSAFYRALGMVEKFRFPASGRVDQLELAIGGFTLGLSSRDALARLAGLTAESGPPRSEVVFWCADVDAMFERARRAGARPVAAPRTFNQRLRAAWLEDPEGHRLKLVALLSAPTAPGSA